MQPTISRYAGNSGCLQVEEELDVGDLALRFISAGTLQAVLRQQPGTCEPCWFGNGNGHNLVSGNCPLYRATIARSLSEYVCSVR
jgi:hypothetical protein